MLIKHPNGVTIKFHGTLGWTRTDGGSERAPGPRMSGRLSSVIWLTSTRLEAVKTASSEDVRSGNAQRTAQRTTRRVTMLTGLQKTHGDGGRVLRLVRTTNSHRRYVLHARTLWWRSTDTLQLILRAIKIISKQRLFIRFGPEKSWIDVTFN